MNVKNQRKKRLIVFPVVKQALFSEYENNDKIMVSMRLHSFLKLWRWDWFRWRLKKNDIWLWQHEGKKRKSVKRKRKNGVKLWKMCVERKKCSYFYQNYVVSWQPQSIRESIRKTVATSKPHETQQQRNEFHRVFYFGERVCVYIPFSLSSIYFSFNDPRLNITFTHIIKIQK